MRGAGAGEAAYPAVGSTAPELSLPDQRGERVTLSEAVHDRHALLVFFPFAFTPLCTGELLEIQLDIDTFSNQHVQTYAISCDPRAALKVWAAQEGYRFPLLSDFWPHGAAARAYGVLDETSGMAVRGTFLVDPAMTVRWSLVHGPDEARTIGALREALADLPGAS